MRLTLSLEPEVAIYWIAMTMPYILIFIHLVDESGFVARHARKNDG